jgi:hypothetical protein
MDEPMCEGIMAFFGHVWQAYEFPGGRMLEWLACSHSRTSFMRALYQGCEAHANQFCFSFCSRH